MSEIRQNVAYDTAICRNPPLHNFTGDRKKKTCQILNTPMCNYVTFLRKYK